MTTEPFIVINGHAPWCAYIRSLGYLDEEQPCDCAGWDDPDYGEDNCHDPECPLWCCS